MLTFGALIVAATAVHLSDSIGLDDAAQADLSERFRQTIEATTGTTAVDGKTLGLDACDDIVACSAIVRQRSVATRGTRTRWNLVLIRLIAGRSKIRALLRRFDDSGQPVREARVDLPRTPESWAAGIEAVVRDLFPEPERRVDSAPAVDGPSAPRVLESPEKPDVGTVAGPTPPAGPTAPPAESLVAEAPAPHATVWRWGFIGSGAAVLLTGLALDLFLPSSRNRELEGADFVGASMMVAGGVAVATGIFFNPYEEP